MENEINFTSGKILSPLIRFSIPIFLAILLQALYGAIDLIIIGKFSSTGDVSAVATGSQVMQLVTHIVVGLTMGITVLMGQRIGEKHNKTAGRIVGASTYLFGVIALISTIIFIFTARPLAGLMHAPTEAFNQTIQYIMICSIGIVFIVAYNVIASVLRSIGNSKLPLLFVAIACAVNIVADLILVAHFNMGVVGAAIATVLAQAINVMISLAILRKYKLPFKIKRQDFAFHKFEMKSILKLGYPIALQSALTSLSFLVIVSILNNMGVVISAGTGVAQRVAIFLLLTPISFMSAVSVFTAQNIGAEKPKRAKKAMYYAMITSLCVSLIIFVVGFWYGDILASFFTNDSAVKQAAFGYIKAFAIDSIIVSFLFCYTGYFNGCGKTFFVMLQSVASAFLIRIPLSYAFSRIPETNTFLIGLATPAATLFGLAISFSYYKFAKWNKTSKIKPLDELGPVT